MTRRIMAVAVMWALIHACTFSVHAATAYPIWGRVNVENVTRRGYLPLAVSEVMEIGALMGFPVSEQNLNDSFSIQLKGRNAEFLLAPSNRKLVLACDESGSLEKDEIVISNIAQLSGEGVFPFTATQQTRLRTDSTGVLHVTVKMERRRRVLFWKRTDSIEFIAKFQPLAALRAGEGSQRK